MCECNLECNVPSCLSLQWFCDDSCTWAHDVQLNPSYAHLASVRCLSTPSIVYILSYWENIGDISVNKFWKVQFISREKLKRPILDRSRQ